MHPTQIQATWKRGSRNVGGITAYGLWVIIILVALVLFATSTTKKKS